MTNFMAMTEVVKQQCKDELFGIDWFDPTCYSTEILDAKYDPVSTDKVLEQCSHLSTEKKEDLRQVLQEFPKLFSGKLGVYPHCKFHIDIDPNAKPKHAQPYALPRIHLAAFKKELEHLVKLGVLS